MLEIDLKVGLGKLGMWHVDFKTRMEKSDCQVT